MKFSLVNALVFSTSITSFASACIYKRAMDQETYDYDGENGPVNWHHVNRTAYGLCAHGKEQSPINVEPALTRAEASLSYPAMAAFMAENNGHTIQFTPKEPSKFKAKLGGQDYELLQFHFHTPSEHHLNKEHYPLEVHFVHQNPTTKAFGVVGVFFEIGRGTGDPFLSSFYHQLSAISADGAETDANTVLLSSIHDVVRRAQAFNYKGSLTTPPCTEGINWFVAEHPLEVSVEQYIKMKQIMKFNSRFTQNEPKELENIIDVACKA